MYSLEIRTCQSSMYRINELGYLIVLCIGTFPAWYICT